jgi:NADPH:quinone reductase-like Zn-dependent oxidoreductase
MGGGGEGGARMSNRAVVQTRFPGKGEGSLDLVHRPIPRASPKTVVIRLTTRSVNPNDLTNIRDNKLQSFQDAHHPVIGSEGCGHIFEVLTILGSIFLCWASVGNL